MIKNNKENKVLKWFKDNFSIRMITINAFIAAIYVVLTIMSYPLSYGLVQFRISEILNILVFFNPIYTIGLTVGCLISNIMSWSPYDMLFGTLATLIGCLLMILFSKLTKNLFISAFMPTIANAIIVGLELVLLGFVDVSLYVAMGYVFLGEFVCINIIGYILFMLLAKKYNNFYKLINATNTRLKW